MTFLRQELSEFDPDIFAAVAEENQYQHTTLRMIPSENYISARALKAIACLAVNKYAEGYPGKRYYGGNQFIDRIESLAIERARSVFRMAHANVQAYSGSVANCAVYYALCEVGDPVMGMHLTSGGHLTHGWKVNFSGRFYRSVQYGVNSKTGLIDYDEVARMAREHKPKLIWAGGTAYPRQFDFAKFAEIAGDVGAHFVADVSHINGLIIAGVHNDPAPYASVIMSTTHKLLRGPRGALLLCREELAQKIDRAVFPGLQGGPHEHTIAGIAVCLKEAGTDEYRNYCRQVVRNAKALAEELLRQGFDLVTGGTDNHMILVDLTNKKVTGAVAQEALEEAGIVTNKNTVPGDPRSPFDPSGIRLGTPALTTRGFDEQTMKEVGRLIARVIDNPADPNTLKSVHARVGELCHMFPLWYDQDGAIGQPGPARIEADEDVFDGVGIS